MTEKNKAIIENLADAGCDETIIRDFLRHIEANNCIGQSRILSQHRGELLDRIHTSQKQLDCLDYFIHYQQKRERQNSVINRHGTQKRKKNA